ncbi:MAG: hypothetical protein KGI50_06385 [Patescibacteria group bacterium]|nr:hypothetical protein [Patescibacteria group bacterium]
MTENQRTIQQNKALHLYFRLLAETLNDAGLDMRVILKPEVEIPWTPKNIKEYLWRPVQRIQLGKKSSTELTTKDIDVIYDTINLHLSKHGVHVPFPSIEEMSLRQIKC